MLQANYSITLKNLYYERQKQVSRVKKTREAWQPFVMCEAEAGLYLILNAIQESIGKIGEIVIWAAQWIMTLIFSS